MNRSPLRPVLAIAVTAIALATLATVAARAQTADPERGALLYANHCASCHTTEVHFREQRKSKTLADVRDWVVRWTVELELDWTGEEVDDVARHLNERFYRFAE